MTDFVDVSVEFRCNVVFLAMKVLETALELVFDDARVEGCSLPCAAIKLCASPLSDSSLDTLSRIRRECSKTSWVRTASTYIRIRVYVIPLATEKQ